MAPDLGQELVPDALPGQLRVVVSLQIHPTLRIGPEERRQEHHRVGLSCRWTVPPRSPWNFSTIACLQVAFGRVNPGDALRGEPETCLGED